MSSSLRIANESLASKKLLLVEAAIVNISKSACELAVDCGISNNWLQPTAVSDAYNFITKHLQNIFKNALLKVKVGGVFFC